MISRVVLSDRRIFVDGRPRLVLAGEVHYFRLNPPVWAERLDQLRAAGCDTVATYVPWLWHERPDRSIDLRDFEGFLELAGRTGLQVIVRPGPWVMAELKNEGIPYRVANLDYLDPSFLAAADDWYAAVMPVWSRFAGLVIGVQLDNEIGMPQWVTNTTPLALTDRSPAGHDAHGLEMRDRFRRYVDWLIAAAERHGVTGVPFLINVHGTAGGRGRTFPIGLSQLSDAYHGRAQLTSGTDLYLGDLTVTNVADLYVANAFTAATNGPDQPLTSLEFEAGNGDYGEDLSLLIPPEAVELKTRLSLAQGNRLLNYYLFAGGHNPPLAEPVGDGNDRIAITGERHGFAAPISPSGVLTAGYFAVARVLESVRGVADLLADSDEEHDGLALGLVRDHYLTEYRHPDSPTRAAQVEDLERFRGMGPRDVLARALLLGGFSFPAVDLQRDDCRFPVLALGSPATLRADLQRRLADYVLGGGHLLLHGVMPDRDHDGTPCTILAEALGVRVTGRVEAGAQYFPSVVGSVVGSEVNEVRVGYAQLMAASALAEPLLTEIGSGKPCAYRLHAGAGRAAVIGADYPCDLDFWRSVAGWLGAVPRFRHDARAPGLVTTSTVDGSGQRLLHLVNVGPTALDFALTFRDEPVLDGRRLHLGARAGLMMPMGLAVPGATIVASTCELLRVDGSTLTLRPTQPTDVVVLSTDRRVLVRNADVRVDGHRVTVTGRFDRDFELAVQPPG